MIKNVKGGLCKGGSLCYKEVLWSNAMRSRCQWLVYRKMIKMLTRLWGIIVRIIPGASLTAPEDECLACTLTRKQRPYLSNDCSLFHCVEARTDFACSLGSRGHTWATIALCFIVWGKDGLQKTMRNNSTNHSGGIIDSTWGHVPGLHAHSEAEAILEQRLLFVPLCWGKDRLRMFTRKQRPYLSNDCSLFHCVRQGWPSQDSWGIIVRIIPEASLTTPEDECLACTLTQKGRPY